MEERLLVFKMKKILFITFITLITLITLITFVSADLGTYKQDEMISVRANLNATSVNVTIYYPNSSIAIENQAMGNLRGNIWNYTFSNTNTIGIHTYDYCNQDGDNCKENTFTITKTGFIFESSESTLIFALLFVLLILTFSFFYLASINLTEAPWLNFPLKIGGLLLGFVMTYSVLRIVRNLARDFIVSGYFGAPLNVLLKLMTILIPIIFLIAAGVIVFDILLSLRIETEKVGRK